MRYISIILFLFLALSVRLFSQEEQPPNRNSSTKKEAVRKLSKSLEEGKPDDILAKDYETLAKEYANSGAYAKAEEYWEKAKKIYTKANNKEKVAIIERELAKVQEAQNKIPEALSNYNGAMQNSTSDFQRRINSNDVNRLMNQSKPKLQKGYLQDNINLLEYSDNESDKTDAYKQMAQVNMLMKEYDKAIEINEKLVVEAQKSSNQQAEIEQLRELSKAYFAGNKSDKGLESLQRAYDLAIEQKNTLNAKKNLDLLAEQYMKMNNTPKVLELYTGFIQNLESLIRSDSSLVDAKTIQAVEEKIVILEKERKLQNELLKRKNTITYFLIGFSVLMLIFAGIIIKIAYSINRKNKKIALQSLRREMNPHFIFNSLNSINQFIAHNQEIEANKYLSSYSKLMRNVMTNSNTDFIPLSVEVTQLKEYLELERMRFGETFTYQITIDPSLDRDAVYVPNMLIQPQLENAIWHGLRYKESKGLLSLTIDRSSSGLQITVEDNGIGIKQSQALKTPHQKQHRSRGVLNTRERINLLNSLYRIQIEIDIIDKPEHETGVIVIIKIPLLDKSYVKNDSNSNC